MRIDLNRITEANRGPQRNSSSGRREWRDSTKRPLRDFEAGREMVSETLRNLLRDPEFRRTLESKLMEVIEERFKEG